jgi:hypothetical protein
MGKIFNVLDKDVVKRGSTAKLLLCCPTYKQKNERTIELRPLANKPQSISFSCKSTLELQYVNNA